MGRPDTQKLPLADSVLIGNTQFPLVAPGDLGERSQFFPLKKCPGSALATSSSSKSGGYSASSSFESPRRETLEVRKEKNTQKHHGKRDNISPNRSVWRMTSGSQKPIGSTFPPLTCDGHGRKSDKQSCQMLWLRNQRAGALPAFNPCKSHVHQRCGLDQLGHGTLAVALRFMRI